MSGKRYLSGVLFLFSAFAIPTMGQIPENDPYLAYSMRMSVEADYKIRSGLHLIGETEIREGKNFLSAGRIQTSAGVSYKISPRFKVETSYTLIGKRESLSSYKMRHRISGNLTASFSYGNWKFSVREGIQMTNRPNKMNRFQNPRNLLELKSRLKEEYSFNRNFSQYSFVEVRTVLNKPSLSGYHYDESSYKYVDASGDAVGEPGWFFDGYGDSCVNRIRLCLGMEHKWNKHRSFDLYLCGDYCNNLKIDANSSGTRLKSLVHDRYFRISPGMKYTFSF